MGDFGYFDLSEDKESYTIPEVVAEIGKQFKLGLPKRSGTKWKNMTKEEKNDVAKRKKAIYRKLYRALKQEHYESCQKLGGRDTQYPRNAFLYIVNHKPYGDFVKMSDGTRYEEYKKFQEKASDYAHAYRAMLESGERDEFLKNLVEHDEENYAQEQINKNVTQMKYRIFMDFAIRLFEFDEKLAREDYEIMFYADEESPSPQEIAAYERLKDISNYYNKSVMVKIEKLLSLTDKIEKSISSKIFI